MDQAPDFLHNRLMMDPVSVHIQVHRTLEERSGAWDTGWRMLPAVLIERPSGGSWTCHHQRGRTVVADGELLVVPASVPHRLTKRRSGPMRSSWAYLAWHRVDGREVRIGRLPRVLPRSTADGLAPLLSPLRGESESLRAQAAALQVLAELRGRQDGDADAPDEPVARAIARMRSELHRPLTREQLARHCHLAHARFHQRFVAATGEAPMRYLARLRLQRAERLLTAGELPLKAIAERCGYASQAYFTRVFTRAFGEPPGRYRRRLLGHG